MPIGEMPIIELLLRQLKAHGADEVTLLTGHLAYLIEGYIGDGRDIGLKVDYVHEEEPLGTAGPLRALAGRVTDDFLVMNGDLLTDVDYGALLQQHRATGAIVTISTFSRQERLELGVLSTAADGAVIGYDEKPTLDLTVSMGLYAMSPAALARIPDGYVDMPDLIKRLIDGGDRVIGRVHEGTWFDIGQPDDYAAANELFARDPGAFLDRKS
jgi:NDP-sugar pyrophosphorylase family protein